MKTQHYLILLVISTLFFASCRKEHIHPSHHMDTEERFPGVFQAINVSDAIDVDVTFTNGGSSVFVEANDNVLEHVLTQESGGVLYISIENNIHIGSKAIINVHISNPILEAVDVSGASRVSFQNGLTAPIFELIASGASTFEGGITTQDCYITMSGASESNIWGTTDNADIRLSGASDLGDYGFAINNLDIELSGASHASLTVNQLMNIEASGASTFFYKGSGVISDLELTGASTVKKK